MAWLSTLAQAQGGANPAELARSRACLACHQVDKPRAGPALRDIAKRYRDQPQAEARLAKKLREGGPAVWQMPMGPMPAQTRLSEAEARVLVRWVLATP
jgi:cytochrome c